MYLKYFGLAAEPFSIAPDPQYLYMSQRHQEALAHLRYGVEEGSGGFVLLTGEVGAGKTTICRCLIDQLPDTCDVAYIFNPRLTVKELLSTLCVEFDISYPSRATIKVFNDLINAYLLEAHAAGRHSVLIIDEAQNLSPEVLEQMRLLTNLETSQRKLLQIILLGQSELAEMLERHDMRQVAQRIIARYHLGPLDPPDVENYIRHRLEVSGASVGAREIFPRRLIPLIYRLSGGVPRLLNVLCDRALLGTYVQGRSAVDRTTLKEAAREVLPAGRTGLAALRLWNTSRWPLPPSLSLPPSLRGWRLAALAAGLVGIIVLALFLAAALRPAKQQTSAAVPPPTETVRPAAGK